MTGLEGHAGVVASPVLHAIRTYLSRDRWQDSLLLELRDFMFGGHLAVRYGQLPRTLEPLEGLRFTPDAIDWEMQWEPITNTCQLYLHSLEPAKTLIQSYEVDPRAEAIDLAIDILSSWMRYAERDEVVRFTWYDNAVADRAAVFIYLAEMIEGDGSLIDRREVVPALRAALVEHARWLFADENYTGQNHGVMINRALYLVAQYLRTHSESESWRTKAVQRLREGFRNDYSADMVGVENASNYHVFNLDLYVTVEKHLLNPFGDTLADDFDRRIKKAVRFLVQLSKPDRALPVIGDGSRTTLDLLSRQPGYEHIKNHPQLQYVMSDGAHGSPPKRRFAVYREEGYAFARTSWDLSKRDRIAYASFRAGHLVDNHKHADDLSFTYYAHGRDIFVDAGTFTYEPGLARNYYLSAPAHNTLVVDGKTYPVRSHMGADPSHAAIVDSGSTASYDYVTGRNDAFAGVHLTRTMFFLRKSGRLVIVDEASSDEEHTYSQMFHFSHRLEPDAVRVNPRASANVSFDGVTASVAQAVPATVVVHHGRSERLGLGLVSEGWNVAHESATLEYQQMGRSVRFVTAVSADVAPAAPFDVQVVRRGVEVMDGDETLLLQADGAHEQEGAGRSRRFWARKA